MITVVLALAAASTLASELQSRDQALVDAIAVGDRATWERTLTPDAIYVDENGVTMSRSELMADFDPLPAGVSGQIRIVDYKVKQVGDTALVVHRDEEQKSRRISTVRRSLPRI
jgi:uncharacterized protein DUF4440